MAKDLVNFDRRLEKTEHDLRNVLWPEGAQFERIGTEIVYLKERIYQIDMAAFEAGISLDDLTDESHWTLSRIKRLERLAEAYLVMKASAGENENPSLEFKTQFTTTKITLKGFAHNEAWFTHVFSCDNGSSESTTRVVSLSDRAMMDLMAKAGAA